MRLIACSLESASLLYASKHCCWRQAIMNFRCSNSRLNIAALQACCATEHVARLVIASRNDCDSANSSFSCVTESTLLDTKLDQRERVEHLSHYLLLDSIAVASIHFSKLIASFEHRLKVCWPRSSEKACRRFLQGRNMFPNQA